MSVRIDLGHEGLDRVRFTSSAVWETVASLHAIAFPQQHALHHRLRGLVPIELEGDLRLLMALTGDKSWFPDLLAPAPRLDPGPPCEQFRALVHTPSDILESDLAVLRARHPELARGLTPQRLATRVADELQEYWERVLNPLWDRVEAVTADDLGHHARLMAREGVAGAVSAIHDEISHAGSHLSIAFHHTSTEVRPGPDGVWLVPSVFRWPWVAGRFDCRTTVISYAARGSARVWETSCRMSEDGGALAALLGRSRAMILSELDVPRTTTWLARHLDLSPGTVSDHLSILTSSGLLKSRRDGRRVLYQWSALGEDLVDGDPQARGRQEIC